VAILGLAVASFALGCIGFWKLGNATGATTRLLDVCYLALQLFTLESGAVSGPAPWELEVARYLAPLVPAWTLVKALALLFHEQIVNFRMRFLSGHVVICGLGRKGLQLAREFRAEGRQVVVIDIDEENARLKTCQELGALTLAGDAADRAVLLRARVFRAGHVIAVCGEDGKNVEVAVLACGLVHGHGTPVEAKVECVVHIVDLKLCALFKQHRVFIETTDRFEASVVNLYVNVARSLLEDEPLDWAPIAPEDPRRVHLVIVGFGRAGESAILQAVRIGHYANGQRLRISVVDREADAKKQGFYARYPHFDEVCDATFVTGDVEDREVLDQIGRWAGSPDALPTILVSLGSDSASVIGALNVVSHVSDARVPVLVRVAEQAALASLLTSEQGAAAWTDRIRPVGLLSRVCTRRMFLNKELDLLARAIHEDYVAKRKAQGVPDGDPSLQPWEQLDQGRKDSNRQQADHVPVKLRAIDCRAVAEAGGPGRAFTFTDDAIELLARMEHARWKAHRFLTGWTRGPSRDPEKKTSPYLVDWDELPEFVKEQNREPVRNIPRLLGLVGRRIERRARHESSPEAL